MPKVCSSFAGIVLGLLMMVSAYSQPEQPLEELREKLVMIRASSGDQPVDLVGPLPKIDDLRGASRDAVRSALGIPDNCDGNDNECATQPSWAYRFYYLPQGWRGGGSELWFTFDASGLAQEVRWKFSR